nr:reverse transcriptase domain-containing protein [Tanacetum cinerariifolium]
MCDCDITIPSPLLLDKKNQSSALAHSPTPAPVKAVEPNCVTYGGAHSYQNCPATSVKVYRDNIQEYVSQAAAANYNQGNTRSGTLPSNTITNPKEDLKGITTRSGVAYQGPTIPTPSKVMKQGTEVTKDQVQTPSSQSTALVQPPVVQPETQTLVSEPVVAPKFYEIFQDMSFEISFTDALILIPKFASTLKALIGNKEKLSEMAKTSMNEHCSAIILNKLPKKLRDPSKFLIPCEFPGMDECLALADLGASINLMPLSVWEGLSLLKLTMTCITLELADRSISKPIGIVKDVSVKVGVFHFPANFVVVDFKPDPRVPLILGSNPTPYDDPIVSTTSPTLTSFGDSDFLLFEEADAFLGLEDDPNSSEFNPFYYDPEGDILLLKTILNSKPLPTLPNHEQYMPSFKKELKGDNKLPVIIAKELGDEEKSAQIKVLKSHNRAIAWKLSDIQGINQKFYTHKILMEEDYKPAEKTIFTCPYGTFAYRRMPFGLCNAPGMFQRCMLAIFHDMVEKTMEVFMNDFSVFGNSFKNCLSRLDKMLQRCMLAIFHDMVEKTMEVFMNDFSVFGNSFKNCLSRLDKMLQRCEDTNLCLNWEKSHFMVKDGIVLGHKISKNEIEVDKAKVDVIAKLPHPTTVKGIQSFLGHTSFYQRFIQDFSKISRPMTHRLERNTSFIFSEECIKAFQMLKKKLTEAPILIAPNWDLLFKLICDASDFAIVHTDHSALKCLFAKKDAKARLLRWVILLQEFDFKVLDTKGAENLAADHLS